MENQLRQQGIVDLNGLRKSTSFPSEKRLAEGPVAIIECLQEIPCNPCEFVCPEGAIKVGRPLTNLPVFREDKCTGCTLCIPQCPGMAIFVVDLAYSPNQALIHFPYEFLPLPAIDDNVDAVNREGVVVAKAGIKKVRNPEQFAQTAIISVVVPKDMAMEVRNIRISGKRRAVSEERRAKTAELSASGCQPLASSKHLKSDKKRTEKAELIPHPSPVLPIPSCVEGSVVEGSLLPHTMCRCEEIDAIEIKQALDQGADSIKGIKNRTRAGMGLCQGKICSSLSGELLSKNTNLGPEDIEPPSTRPPVRPIELGSLAAGRKDD